MAKQTFTTGQVLTAAQMTSLQQTAMGGGSTTAKTTSYVLTAADAGTVVQMNSASPTTITVNTALFAAGDTVQIQNIGAGVCTVTAGTATVSTAGSLALSQYEGGQLYFNSTSAAIFFDIVQSAAAGGKVLQVVSAVYGTSTTITSTSFTDTGLTATITPTLSTSKILVLISQPVTLSRTGTRAYGGWQYLRGATVLNTGSAPVGVYVGGSEAGLYTIANTVYLDSPATTSATTYKTQGQAYESGVTLVFQSELDSTITLMEIGA